MLDTTHDDSIPLPKGWPRRVRSAVIHSISLAHYSLTATRSWAANSLNARVRLKQENDSAARSRRTEIQGVVCAGSCCRSSRGGLRAEARCPRRFLDGEFPVGDDGS
jgi:hypothetical protein